MRTSPSPTCDSVTIVIFHIVTIVIFHVVTIGIFHVVTIVIFHVVAHSLHIIQTLASPALHSSPTHLHISCAGLDAVLL